MSRLGVLSDIHGNLHALEAVLTSLEAERVDRIVCCGDLVGAGTSPSEVLDLCEEASVASVRGNHEDAVCHHERYRQPGREEGRRLVESIRSRLTSKQLRDLHDLPMTLVEDAWMAVHGSLRGPMWEYILDTRTAAESFRLLERPIGFFGHSHIQGAFAASQGEVSAIDATSDPIALDPAAQFLVNPGSVGLPRDGDPRPAFAVVDLDERSLAFHRIPCPKSSSNQTASAAPRRHQ